MNYVAPILKCCGACELHSSDVKLVHVKGWGEFQYCTNAIAEDHRRGLIVTEIEQKEEQ